MSRPRKRPATLRLEKLELEHVRQGWASPRAGKSVDGNPLRIGGETFRLGVGTHAHAEFLVDLKGAARSFSALAGVDDEVGPGKGSVEFEFWVDRRPVLRTPLLRGGDKAHPVEVDLRGAREFIIVVHDGGDGTEMDHADLANARFQLSTDIDKIPTLFPLPDQEAPEIAPFDPKEPGIHAPSVTGCSPGRHFLFRIPATGPKGMAFEASGLPDGVSLDARRGILWGAVRRAGKYPVRLRIGTGSGGLEKELLIVAGRNKLALTPPMGWNSWNCWGTAVDQERVLAAAHCLDRTGLASVGYQYINIDDCWQGKRGKDGVIQPNERFPSMKALTDAVHQLGLRTGIYSSPGTKTCAGYTGSFRHEQQDARTYAEWGMDYLKYDLCSYIKRIKRGTEEEHRAPYDVMRQALDAVDHDIVYAICQAGLADVWKWGAKAGGNLWRTTEDIVDTWGSMAGIGFRQAPLKKHAAPGRWNDPDMLVVGKVGWGAEVRPTRLTPVEQVTHLTLWSLLAAPLLTGCDLSQLDDFTLGVLGNPEVIAVDQDPLGRQAKPVGERGPAEVWTRPLAGGGYAVGLFNRSPIRQQVRVDWGLVEPGARRFNVRDLWKRLDMGIVEDGFGAELPPHGARLVRLTP